MSVSYNILPIKEVQSNIELKKHLQTLTVYGSINSTKKEEESRFPTRAEVIESIIESELKVVNENKQFDKFELDKGSEFIIHSLEINDTNLSFRSDLTMRYPNNSSKNYRLESLIGIKSDLRILVKITSSLSKKCGSFLILSPYEGYFIDKEKIFKEIWSQIINETKYDSEE